MSSTAAAPARLAVIGAGSRGRYAYGAYCARHPEAARVVAVAEPDDRRRREMADEHGLGPHGGFADWRDLLTAGPAVDAVVVATPDRGHVEPTVAAVAAGLPVLLEKPVAPTADELHRLRSGVGDSAHLVTVAHVLRYTPFFRRIKALLDRGAIGELVTIEHMEHIGYWHFAHSYVRGNWRRADASSPMILAKACHDLDLLRWFAGAPWRSVASYGSLHHFHGGNRPEGAPDRCAEGCPVAPDCPFDATRIYDADQPIAGPTARRAVVDGWPDDKQALLHSPYGRCVYACDNDVPDHQVVSVEFDSGVTAALTVTAFTAEIRRTLRLLGTRGELSGDLGSGAIEVTRFPTASGGGSQQIDELGDDRDDPNHAFLGHAGGDEGLMRAFVGGVIARRDGTPAADLPTDLSDAVESHLMAFAAEHSRLTGTSVRRGG